VRPTEAHRERAAWAAVTIGGVLLAFAPAVLGGRTLAHRDTDQLYAPVRTLVVEALRGGRLPLWNPHEGTGIPLFAQGLHSVLHPISLAGAALAPASMDFLVLAYLVAAALGAFVLAQTLGASGVASAGAGLAFALSGFSASMTGNLVFLAGLATLPWLLAAARTAGAGARWGPLATALATACAFLSGDAQTALVGLALGILLAVDAGGARGAARALAGMGAGILLAGVQILPTGALLALTFRGVGLEPWETTKWPLEPGRLLEWIVPGLFRGPPAQIPAGASGEPLEMAFAESVYLGVPLLLAATLGALRRSRTAILLAIASIVLLWLALGHRLGARQLLEWVPIWSRFRYAEKLMAPLTLCACAIGALGVDAFATRPLGKGWTRALAAAAAIAGAALLALLLAPAGTRALAVRLVGDAGPFYRGTLAAGLPHLAAALLALLAVDRLRRERPRASALALLVALAPAAAVYHGAHLGSPEARRFVTPLRLASDSPTPRVAHSAERIFYTGDPRDFVEEFARHFPALLVPASNVAFKVDTFVPCGAFKPLRLAILTRSFGPRWAQLARRFGLTHVVAPFPHADAQRESVAIAAEGGRLVQRDETVGFELWEVPHRPWAFFPERAFAAALPEAAHGALLSLMVQGDDGTVVVEAEEAPPTAPGRVLAVERGTGSLRIDAETLGPALLVVQDAFWPGWRAAIDGQPVEILAADFLVRAVRWPGGRHRLEMTYDPPEVRTGLALSAAGGLLALVLAAIALRRGTVTR
jgi:hypothetical protein